MVAEYISSQVIVDIFRRLINLKMFLLIFHQTPTIIKKKKMEIMFSSSLSVSKLRESVRRPNSLTQTIVPDHSVILRPQNIDFRYEYSSFLLYHGIFSY